MNTLRTLKKITVLSSLVFTLCVISGGFAMSAYADMWGDIADNIKNSGSTIQGRGYFQVHIQNNSRKTIWVAVIYGDEDRGITIFRKKGWWKLAPGKNAYIADTKYRTIYFYAHDSDGAKWRGNHSSKVLDSSFDAAASTSFGSKSYYVKFFEVDMGGRFTTFTQNFN